MEYYAPNGMITYFDYDEALSVARKLKKPLMLDFTGIDCMGCKKMEVEVLSNRKVAERLKDDFVTVLLYVDVQNIRLQESEQYYSKTLGKKIETVGDKNADLQVTKFGANTQPYYFFLDGDESKLAQDGYGYNPDINKFLDHLNKVKTTYQKRQQ